MRKIELQVLDDHVMVRGENGQRQPGLPFSFRENLLAILGAPLADGLKLAQIRQLDRVYRVIEATPEGTVLELEDADYDILLQHVNTVNYPGYNRYMCRLIEALEGAGREENPAKPSE